MAASGADDGRQMARRIRYAQRAEQAKTLEERHDSGAPPISSTLISLARCKELLGDEASGLSDDELDQVRRHTAAMAHALVLAFLEGSSTPD